MSSDYGEWRAEAPFDWVEGSFFLDSGSGTRRSGYRPIWRFTLQQRGQVLVGLNEMTAVDADVVEPGSASKTRWRFASGVQGYVEALVREGGEAEICDGHRRVGVVRDLVIVQ